MAITTTVATIEEYLKEHYNPKEVMDLTMKAAGPLYGLMEKDYSWGGKNQITSTIYQESLSNSATFAKANANRGGMDGKAFDVRTTDLVESYSFFDLGGKLMRISRGQGDALFDYVDSRAKMSFKTLVNRISQQMYRDSIGYISTIDSTTTLTTDQLIFNNRQEGRYFTKGNVLQFANPTGPALRDSGAELTIDAIDRDGDTAVATMSANLNTVTGIAVGDYILRTGDFNGAMTGVSAWIPQTAPTSGDSHFSVDRSDDVQALAGIRQDASGKSILTALIEGVSLTCEYGGGDDPLSIFLDPVNFRKAREEIRGNTTQYKDVQSYARKPYAENKKMRTEGGMDGGSHAKISYSGFQIDGDKGPVTVYSDNFCQPNTGYILELDRWTLVGAGDIPGWLDEDGLQILRESDADGYTGRVGCYSQIICNGPGHNMVIYNLL